MPIDEARQRVRQNVIKSGRVKHQREEKAQEEKPSGYCWRNRWFDMGGLRFRRVQGIAESSANDCSCFPPQLSETGVFTSLRRLFAFLMVNECNRDVSPTSYFCCLAFQSLQRLR